MGVESLAKSLNADWSSIWNAAKESDAQRNRLKGIVDREKIDSSDISVVVFGSLARREWTSGSDLDWTLLIDGEADHEHANTAHRLRSVLEEEKFQNPGATETFGTLTFSHDLVHQIGGLDDSNRNTTRRLLMLLESMPASRRDAYGRVVRGILRRYLENDYRDFRLKVPRFLLNDFHRYWRTICVDYASKYRDQAAKKWGLRNVKLRLSRKLIFAAGVLSCFRCDPGWIAIDAPDLAKTPDVDGLVEYMEKLIGQTPLDIIASVLEKFGDKTAAGHIFNSYNDFLEKLDNPSIRKHLEKLKPENAKDDSIFQEMMVLSESFELGLERLFFDNDAMDLLTKKYGVF